MSSTPTAAVLPVTERSAATFDRPQFRRLLAMAKPYRGLLALGALGVVVSQGLGLVFPRVIGSLVDVAFVGGELDRIALMLLGVVVLQVLFHGLRVYCLVAMGEGVIADLRRRVYSHLMTLPVKFFADKRTGELTSRLTSDVGVIQAVMSFSLAAAFAQTITLIGGTVSILLISPKLSMSVAIFLPFAVVVAMSIGRKIRKASMSFQDRVAEATANAAEAIAAKPIVQWFNAEAMQVERYSDSVNESYRIGLHRAKLQAMMRPLVMLLSYGTLAFVLWQGGALVQNKELTPGQLVEFLLFTIIVAGSIAAFTRLYSQMQEALGSTKRLFELLDQHTTLVDPPKPVVLDKVEGRISYQNVHFSYSDRLLNVLEGIDLEVEPGEVVAVVGPSGSGKSTLVSLLPRFYDPTAGCILLDGVDLRAQRVFDLRSHMAAVPQDTYLFSGTLDDNLRMGKPDATTEELRQAAIAANAHDFIESFPRGYDTVVGERGIKLSGGQRQRVAIARALLKDPRILVLDEATSSLDAESEALVQEALEVLMRGRTTLVVAHRLSTVRKANRIVVLSEGRIVQQGTHDELIAMRGMYADLYDTQFEGT